MSRRDLVKDVQEITVMVTALQVRADKLGSELLRAQAVFESYAVLHEAKGTEDGKKKALVNRGHANRIKQLLESSA